MKVRLRPRPGKLRPLPKGWPAIRQRVRQRDGGFCRYCGGSVTIKGGDVNHLVPRRLGGTDAMDNLALLCERHRLTATQAEVYLFERADPFPWTTFLRVVCTTGPVPDERVVQAALGCVRRLLEKG